MPGSDGWSRNHDGKPAKSAAACDGCRSTALARINQIAWIGLASTAFISIRSPDRGRKAIFRGHRDRARQATGARIRVTRVRGGVFVQETGLRNGAFGADKFGLENRKRVHANLGAP